MRYRFAWFWAHVLIVLGVVCLIAGPLLGVAAVLVPTVREAIPFGSAWVPLVAAVLAGIVAGLFLGGPLILAGELVLVILDQRRLLVSINRRLKARKEDAGRDEGARRMADRYVRR